MSHENSENNNKDKELSAEELAKRGRKIDNRISSPIRGSVSDLDVADDYAQIKNEENNDADNSPVDDGQVVEKSAMSAEEEYVAIKEEQRGKDPATPINEAEIWDEMEDGVGPNDLLDDLLDDLLKEKTSKESVTQVSHPVDVQENASAQSASSASKGPKKVITSEMRGLYKKIGEMESQRKALVQELGLDLLEAGDNVKKPLIEQIRERKGSELSAETITLKTKELEELNTSIAAAKTELKDAWAKAPLVTENTQTQNTEASSQSGPSKAEGNPARNESARDMLRNQVRRDQAQENQVQNNDAQTEKSLTVGDVLGLIVSSVINTLLYPIEFLIWVYDIARDALFGENKEAKSDLKSKNSETVDLGVTENLAPTAEKQQQPTPAIQQIQPTTQVVEQQATVDSANPQPAPVLTTPAPVATVAEPTIQQQSQSASNEVGAEKSGMFSRFFSNVWDGIQGIIADTVPGEPKAAATASEPAKTTPGVVVIPQETTPKETTPSIIDRLKAGVHDVVDPLIYERPAEYNPAYRPGINPTYEEPGQQVSETPTPYWKGNKYNEEMAQFEQTGSNLTTSSAPLSPEAEGILKLQRETQELERDLANYFSPKSVSGYYGGSILSDEQRKLAAEEPGLSKEHRQALLEGPRGGGQHWFGQLPQQTQTAGKEIEPEVPSHFTPGLGRSTDGG